MELSRYVCTLIENGELFKFFDLYPFISASENDTDGPVDVAKKLCIPRDLA
jgi:hypothetical protein